RRSEPCPLAEDWSRAAARTRGGAAQPTRNRSTPGLLRVGGDDLALEGARRLDSLPSVRPLGAERDAGLALAGRARHVDRRLCHRRPDEPDPVLPRSLGTNAPRCG